MDFTLLAVFFTNNTGISRVRRLEQLPTVIASAAKQSSKTESQCKTDVHYPLWMASGQALAMTRHLGHCKCPLSVVLHALRNMSNIRSNILIFFLIKDNLFILNLGLK
jgi:hypothetical protein